MTRSDQQPKAVLPCPDPECGGTLHEPDDGSFCSDLVCDKCYDVFSAPFFADLLAQVRQELENAMELVQEFVCDDGRARIASLERKLAEAEEALACGIGDDALPPWDGYVLNQFRLLREYDDDHTPTGFWLLDDARDHVSYREVGTLAKCLTALRRELEGSEEVPDGE